MKSMKKINLNELALRIVSSTSRGILLYLVLSLVNFWFSIRAISLIFTVVISLISFISAIILKNTNIKDSTNQILYISIGALMSISIVAIFNVDRSIPALFINALEYSLIWISTMKSVNCEVSGLYHRELFYRNLAIIFVINIIYYTIGDFKEYSTDINQAGIMLIVLSLLLLIGIRNASTMKNDDNPRKLAQEAGKIVAILLFIFIFSSTWLQTNLLSLVSFIAGLVFQGIFFLSRPVLYALAFVAEKLKSIVTEGGSSDSGFSGNDKTQLDALNEFDYSSLQQLGSIISIIIVVLAITLIIYFSYKYFMKSKSKENECDYSESREFIIKTKEYKSNGRFSALKKRMNNILDDIKLGIGTDYDLKIRNEYKKFLIVLLNRKIVKDNATASDIFQQLGNIVSNDKDGLEALTCIYEKIRYGGKGSDKEEYENFQKSMKAVMKVLQ